MALTDIRLMAANCFYVGSSCQAFFVFRGVEASIPQSVFKHSFVVALISYGAIWIRIQSAKVSLTAKSDTYHEANILVAKSFFFPPHPDTPAPLDIDFGQRRQPTMAGFMEAFSGEILIRRLQSLDQM